MKLQGVKRLKKLAEHLYNGKLIHEKFHFGYFNNGMPDEKGCGTMGCAIGECPGIFEEWEFRFAVPLLKKQQEYRFPTECASAFFHIDRTEALALFIAKHQGVKFNLKLLDEEATKEQVADNIKTFITNKGFDYETL